MSNVEFVNMAYLSHFCNFQQFLELYRHRLLISKLQVRVLGGSLLTFLQTAVKLESLDVLLFVGDPAPQDFAQLVKPYRL